MSSHQLFALVLCSLVLSACGIDVFGTGEPFTACEPDSSTTVTANSSDSSTTDSPDTANHPETGDSCLEAQSDASVEAEASLLDSSPDVQADHQEEDVLSDTSVPETSLPDTTVPDVVSEPIPDTSLPDTSVPDTNVPETTVPDSKPEAGCPEGESPCGTKCYNLTNNPNNCGICNNNCFSGQSCINGHCQ